MKKLPSSIPINSSNISSSALEALIALPGRLNYSSYRALAVLLALLLGICLPVYAESWNILIYMAADNNLAHNAILDFNSMESTALPPGVRVYLQTDLPANHALAGGRRWALGYDQTEQIASTQLANLGTINSGDPATLSNFITWGLNQYSAQRKMLVIWSHGDSWYKSDENKYICPDDGASAAMSVSSGHLKTALAAHSGFDILLFDACSMQVIEVITEVSGFADYIIGSQDLVPVRGFPYPDILPLFAGDLESILRLIPQKYTQSYDAHGSQNSFSIGLSTTCSSISSAGAEAFVEAWGAFSRRYRESAEELLQIRGFCYGLNSGLAEVDIGEFLTQVSLRAHSSALRDDAAALLLLWNEAVISQSAIMYMHEIGSAAIWFPDNPFNYGNVWHLYRKLDFSQTGWLSLLNLAFGEDVAPPRTPANLSLNPLPGSMILSFDAVADPDSLHYRIDLSNQSYYLYPLFQSGRLSISLPYTASGRIELVAIDQSGNESIPAILDFSNTQSKPRILVSPNPGRESLSASWLLSEEPSSPVRLRVYDLRGRVVWEKRISSSLSGQYFLGAEDGIRRLASGIYFLELSSDSEKLRSRFTVLSRG